MRTFVKKPERTQNAESTEAPGRVKSSYAQSQATSHILHVQRTTGNQAVQRMLQTDPQGLEAGFADTVPPHFGHDFSRIPVSPPKAGVIQTKLAINKPGDKYEQEADRIAEQMMRIPEQRLQLACPCGGSCSKCQTKQGHPAYEHLQTQRVQASDVGQLTVPPVVQDALQSAGHPLDSGTRAFMDSGFGHDFSQVRVHTDAKAAETARALNALAYTLGRDIAFGAGQYAPNTYHGRRLLAHELTHVVQQTGGARSKEAAHVQGGQPKSAWGVRPCKPGSATSRQAIQPSSVGDVVQLAQHPAAWRQSRVTIATSVHSFRPTFANTRGGQLTQRLQMRLRDRLRSVATAVGEVGEGSRTFGARPTGGEERAGLTLGISSTATDTVRHRAVVVGNGDYDNTRTMGSTVEPLRDIAEASPEAGAMASTLQMRGYDVRHQDDQTAAQIGALLQAGVAGLGAGDELVFYYHGHGTIEGLIGRDGSVYTPTQMAALRSTARGAQVNLTLALEGCHTGVFVDAIRGAELRDTRAAMRARVGATSGVVQYARRLLLPVLDNAIAIQGQKDAFNTRAQAWWARRYQIEQQMAASPDNTTLITTWGSHYGALQGIWNDLVTAVTPLLSTLRTNAVNAGFGVELSPQITPLSGTFNQDGEQAIQAGLDDLDTILNRVLRETDSRLH